MTILNKRGLIDIQNANKLDFYEHCIFVKQKHVSFGVAEHSTKGILDYIHSNLWGPSQVPSKGGARYTLTFVDNYSTKVWIYTNISKNKVFKHFKQWKTLIEKQTERKIKWLKTDNGLEFCSLEFNVFYKNEGIIRHRTVRHTPQQNRVVEKMNKTILENTLHILECQFVKRFLGRSSCYNGKYNQPFSLISHKQQDTKRGMVWPSS